MIYTTTLIEPQRAVKKMKGNKESVGSICHYLFCTLMLSQMMIKLCGLHLMWV